MRGGLGDRLRVLSQRKAFSEGAHDAKRLVELRQVEGLAADQVEKPRGVVRTPDLVASSSSSTLAPWPSHHGNRDVVSWEQREISRAALEQ